jgi:hypothetical protein
MKTKQHTIYKLADGKRVPGVTTVVGMKAKPQLIDWANRIGLEGIVVSKYVDDKAAIGTLAHDMVVCHLSGQVCDTDDYSKNQISQAENACLSFFEWTRGHKIELIWAEKSMVSELYGFGGTADLFCVVDGKRELIDLKSGSGIYQEHIIQVAGGYKLLMDENGFVPESIRILNIPRTENENWGELVVGRKQIECAKALFLSLLNVYTLDKILKNEMDKEVVYPKKHEVKDGQTA